MLPLHNDLFELVFERLDHHTVASLSGALLGSSLRLPTQQEGVSETPLESLPLRPGVILKDVHVRLLCYDDTIYDVELNFRIRDATAPSYNALVAALYHFAHNLAKAHGVGAYYAGLDPAIDEDTRMFTGKEKGPYFRLP